MNDASSNHRGRTRPPLKKVRVGIVVSNKMAKTVVVAVERLAVDRRFKKYRRQVRKFKAHDEKNACQVGDRVRMVETRPLSREKRWKVVEILSASGGEGQTV